MEFLIIFLVHTHAHTPIHADAMAEKVFFPNLMLKRLVVFYFGLSFFKWNGISGKFINFLIPKNICCFLISAFPLLPLFFPSSSPLLLIFFLRNGFKGNEEDKLVSWHNEKSDICNHILTLQLSKTHTHILRHTHTKILSLSYHVRVCMCVYVSLPFIFQFS